MTPAEINASTKTKIESLEVMMKALQITASAEQIVDGSGIIRKAVLYTDNEDYPLDEPTHEEPKDAVGQEN